MADVAQKVITGNSQPKATRAVVAVAGCKALTASEKTSTNILSSDIVSDQPVALMEVKLDGKFDDRTYYAGTV